MLQIPDCEINHNAIVVVGYNRIVSIKRLLKSLQEAYYASIAVPLVVSIDKSDCTELYDFVENFEWTHGNKYVIIQEKKRGLKEHIYRCGDLSKFFKSVTILEDDLYVSPFFYDYIEQTVSAYGEDVNVAGISLYLEPHNNQKQSEISKRKSLITNTFYKLTLFGCFLSLPKFPHIFDTYF